MQVAKPKKGYKKINYIFDLHDEIPENWNIQKFGTFSVESKDRVSTNNDPLVLSISKKRGFVKSDEYFNKRVFSKNLEHYKLIERDLFAYSTIHLDEGAIALLKEFENGCISPMYTVFKTDSTIDNKFLFYLMKTNRFLDIYSAIGDGSIERRKSVKFSTLEQVSIPLPPLPEQNQIASILSNVDDTLQQTNQIIEQTQRLKKGMIQKLLTRGIGHTKFKKVKWYFGKEIEIPEQWEVLELRKLCKVRQGLQIPISDRFSESGVNRLPYITVKSIHSGKFDEFIENPKKRVICNENDILVTRTGNTGEIVTNIKGVFHNNFFAVDFDRKIMFKDYLVDSLEQPRIQEIIMNLAGITTIPDLNHGDFFRLKITVPPSLPEQKQIASILSNVDTQIQKEKLHKSNLERLKKGLMQKLLTGQIRVKVR